MFPVFITPYHIHEYADNWLFCSQVTDPYLNLFRGLVPPLLGTIDFTPLLGFIILQWLVGALDIGEEDRYW